MDIRVQHLTGRLMFLALSSVSCVDAPMKQLLTAESRDCGSPALQAANRRRHKRCSISVLGRFMRANKQEYPCKLVEISVGGAKLMSPVPVYAGEGIVAYLDQIGGLEGTVTRVFDGGFAIQINATQHKREKLAAQLTWLINKDHISGIEARRHPRFQVAKPGSTLTFSDGTSLDCRVQDVSLSGASIAVDAFPPIGAEVLLGKLRARVVRHHETGIGVEFRDIQEPEALRRYFG